MAVQAGGATASLPVRVMTPSRDSGPRRRRLRVAQGRSGLTMTSPFLALFAVFFAGPLVYSVVLSLRSPLTGAYSGLLNYRTVISDGEFWSDGRANGLLRRGPGNGHDLPGDRLGPFAGRPVLPGEEGFRPHLLPPLRSPRRDSCHHVGLPLGARPRRCARGAAPVSGSLAVPFSRSATAWRSTRSCSSSHGNGPATT